jgi:hypothetical protein
MSPVVSVSASETFAHELVDHASLYLKGLGGTRYKGINAVLDERNIPKVINHKSHLD